MNRASRRLGRRLGSMNGWAAALEKRLWHLAEASRARHPKRDKPPMPR